MPDHAVRLRAVSKSHRSAAGTVTALDDVSLAFPAGTFTAVMGPSGSGKSTLLQCAAGLDRPDAGSVALGGTELTSLREGRLTRLRRQRIGFVFQAFNLLPALTAEQNVALPLRLAGRRPSRARVREVLGQVGLADRGRHRPPELSGGQQQRVALARALITRPDVLFADEPTGALDSATGREVLALLRGMVDGQGQTVVMVTHDPVAASYADRVVFLVDGRVHGELAGAGADAIAARMAGLEAGPARDVRGTRDAPGAAAGEQPLRGTGPVARADPRPVRDNRGTRDAPGAEPGEQTPRRTGFEARADPRPVRDNRSAQDAPGAAAAQRAGTPPARDVPGARDVHPDAASAQPARQARRDAEVREAAPGARGRDAPPPGPEPRLRPPAAPSCPSAPDSRTEDAPC